MPRQASHTRLSTSAEESQRTRPQRHEAAAHEDVLDAKAASPGARLLNGSVQGVTAPQRAVRLAVILTLMLGLALCLGCAPQQPSDPTPPSVGFVPVNGDRSCPSPAPEWHCVTPYPSNFHRAPSGGGQGGTAPRMVLPQQGVPTTTDGERIDFVDARPFDGSSVLPQILVQLPGGVDDSDFVFHHDDLAGSLVVASSPTLLIDTETGEGVGHFVEIDPVPAQVDHRAIILRPMRPLRWGHRYVAVLQRLKRPDGTPIARTATFERIFSNQGATETEKSQAAYYKAHITPVLLSKQVNLSEVVLAWDFTTASQPSVRGRVQAMADDARAQVAAGLYGAVTLTKQQANENADVAWSMAGEVTLPAYIDGEVHPSAHVTTQATEAFTLPFRLLVTTEAVKTLQSGGVPPVVIMGHGFFGDAGEVGSAGYRRSANKAGAIVLGIDWWGLAKPDVGPIVSGLVAKLAPMAKLVDRLEQGLVNVVALAALTRRPPQAAAGVKSGFGLTDLTLPGTSIRLLQPNARLGYYGCSLGHILGASAVALSPDIERAAVQVGGVGFGQIMSRSLPFGSMQNILAGRFANQGETLLALMQLAEALAPVDPASWVEELRTTPSGTSRPVLIHAGIHDSSVPTFSAEVHARGLGLALLTPAARTVWGLEKQAITGATGGLIEIDFKVPNPAELAIAPTKENKVHQGVRHLDPVQEQVGAFLRGDPIPAACSGACDPD